MIEPPTELYYDLETGTVSTEQTEETEVRYIREDEWYESLLIWGFTITILIATVFGVALM